MQQTDSKDSVSLSVEKIIDLVRNVRNELVKDFLKGEILETYYLSKFKKPLSAVKREFFKRDFHELLIQPVDLVHYSKLINQIKETGTASLTAQHSELFYDEIDRVISRY